ncbi:Hypp7812 [Branchiostoma lanceolatum]|uniref:Hypp7812 protein n=1 Tax=Branchiostoma lanceolatum TaxID=7740 RepID=A0A8K0ECM6_BRALA|nr:Hypp7812 [Branchiostoma lanceolatum]
MMKTVAVAVAAMLAVEFLLMRCQALPLQDTVIRRQRRNAVPSCGGCEGLVAAISRTDNGNSLTSFGDECNQCGFGCNKKKAFENFFGKGLDMWVCTTDS